MDIIKLPIGQTAPPDSDCISIETGPHGTFLLNASALLRCGDSDQVESVSLIGGDPYSSYEAAENAGLAWAADHCAERVYISRDAPLPE